MEGSRVEKNEEGGKSKMPWIVAGVIAAALVGGYLGLCSWSMSQDAILPNVSVAGIDVSGLSQAQAQTAVENAVSQQGKDISLTLSYEGMSASLNGGDVIVDAARSAKDAWQMGHENFFTSGFQLASHMLGASSQVPLVIPENEPALNALIDEMSKTVAASGADSDYELEGDRLVLTKGAPALSVDWDQVRAEAGQELRQAFADRFTQGQTTVDKTIQLKATEGEIRDPDFDAIYAALASEAQDAQLDLDTMTVSDHKVGMDFDLRALKAAYQSAAYGEKVSVPVTVIRPKVTREELEGSLFRDLLADVTTNVAGTATRRKNVKLATDACNGIILLPGEIFSYNGATGQRTAAKGYGPAIVYVGGDSVEDIAGGVCQGSSTIYYAVLQTTLEIVERKPHMFAVTYVPDGMDATVSYGNIDFRFRNNTDYPIKLVTSNYDVGGTRKLNVKIYGTNVDGTYAKPTSSVFNVVTPTVRYVADSSVPRGTLVRDSLQNAYRGKSAQTYRTIYAADGTQLERQDMGVSVYKMRPTTYHYNPADGDPSTWVNGQPPAAETPTDPGTTTPTDPGTTTPTDPGTTTPTDPGTTTDPGSTTDPGTTPEPVPPPSDSGVTPIDPEE